MKALKSTDFSFPAQFEKYSGKVRDVYTIMEELVVIVTTDRISAFDNILPKAIPFKGQVLNQIASQQLKEVSNLVHIYQLLTPDPNVIIGVKCTAYPVEVVVRAYLAGHAWRVYKSGERKICGVQLPEGLKEGDKLPEPIITPTTKSTIGHDIDITEAEIVRSGLVDDYDWNVIRNTALELFKKGTELAEKQGLLLVDTKYEFGAYEGKVYLIDEIHTPDSSRYYIADGYEKRQSNGETQIQLSKEFVREWLMANDFQGLDGQIMPEMPDEFVEQVSNRYIDLYEKLMGKSFEKQDYTYQNERIYENILSGLRQLNVPGL